MTPRKTTIVEVDRIEVTEDRRPVSDAAVEVLASSMKEVGLRTPITVARHDFASEEARAARRGDKFVLIAGAHRLAAARKLGWPTIECFVVDDPDDPENEMWQLAENLHRAELTALERDEQIARFIELIEVRQRRLRESNCAESAQKVGHRQQGGLRAAARELNIPETTAREARKVASLSQEAKQAAQESGLDDNRSALLQAASHATPEAQVHSLRERGLLATPIAAKSDRQVGWFASFLLAHFRREEVPKLVTGLQHTNIKSLLKELARQLNESAQK